MKLLSPLPSHDSRSSDVTDSPAHENASHMPLTLSAAAQTSLLHCCSLGEA